MGHAAQARDDLPQNGGETIFLSKTDTSSPARPRAARVSEPGPRVAGRRGYQRQQAGEGPGLRRGHPIGAKDCAASVMSSGRRKLVIVMCARCMRPGAPPHAAAVAGPCGRPQHTCTEAPTSVAPASGSDVMTPLVSLRHSLLDEQRRRLASPGRRHHGAALARLGCVRAWAWDVTRL